MCVPCRHPSVALIQVVVVVVVVVVAVVAVVVSHPRGTIVRPSISSATASSGAHRDVDASRLVVGTLMFRRRRNKERSLFGKGAQQSGWCSRFDACTRNGRERRGWKHEVALPPSVV